MKPRITLAEAALPDQTKIILQEHDSKYYIIHDGIQLSGPATKTAEEELARLVAAPFRPVRQPRIWICGLGLGYMLKEISSILIQKRATFWVAESLLELPNWHRQYLAESPLHQETRLQLVDDMSAKALHKQQETLHAIMIHLDVAPLGPKQRPWIEDRNWLNAAYDALQDGGLLAIAAIKPQPKLTEKLQRQGFDVAEYFIPSSQNAKKTRLQPIWLAKKTKS